MGCLAAGDAPPAEIGWDAPNIPAAIIVSIGAGLATGIGGAFAFFPEFCKRVPEAMFLGVSLALSAGVMLYVSFIEIFAKALAKIAADCSFDDGSAMALTTYMFFVGMLVCVLLEIIVHCLSGGHGHGHDHGHGQSAAPNEQAHVCSISTTDPRVVLSQAHEDDPNFSLDASAAAEVSISIQESRDDKAAEMDERERKRLSRLGMLTALAIGLHNFPEGLATFLSTVTDTGSGISLGVAIAIHNIPEGVCVAMPIYFATGNKWKAFLWSLLSGISEPIGGIVGFAALQPVFTDVVYGCVFSAVGGMMVFIVCHELLPAAHRYLNNGNYATTCFVTGMIIMATSLVLFAL